MSVLMRLSDGVLFQIHESYAKVREGWQLALAAGVFIDVTNAEGKQRLVNPYQVVYISEEDDRPQAAPAGQPKSGEGQRDA